MNSTFFPSGQPDMGQRQTSVMRAALLYGESGHVAQLTKAGQRAPAGQRGESLLEPRRPVNFYDATQESACRCV